jgi:GT2 family glycosyltransferase
LRAAGAPLDRITVYDIASTDTTSAWLARDWPGIRITRLPENLGPNPARNLALTSTGRPYVLLVDADAYVEPAAPKQLRRVFDHHPHAGVATVVVVHADDASRVQYASTSLHFVCEAVNPLMNRPLSERGDDVRMIGTAPGVALLVSVAAARSVGGFDDHFFMGKDDGDFCYRLRTAGFDVIEDPAAVALHQSRPRSTWMFQYQIRNRWYFLLRNYEARTLWVLAPALAVHELLQFGVLLSGGQLRAWRSACRGLWRWRSRLRGDRAAVRARRRVHDAALLTVGPLIVRADLAGHGIGASLKGAYETWLSLYWRFAVRLLPR